MYSMWKIMCFCFTLNHINTFALYQIHKIMFFLATACDPSNVDKPQDDASKSEGSNFQSLFFGVFQTLLVRWSVQSSLSV